MIAAGENPPASTEETARRHGLSFVRLPSRAIEPAVLAHLPREFIEQNLVVPFAESDGVLHVAVPMADDLNLFDRVHYLAARPVALVLASPDDIRQAIARGYRLRPASAAELPLTEEDPGEMTATMTGEGDAPVIRLARDLIAGAIRVKASDIHLEPLAGSLRIRYRVDGVLREAMILPKALQLPLVSRLKIMANVSIAEKRLPQDGRITFAADGRDFDLRVSSLPTIHGESLVMRILDPVGVNLGLPELGLLADDRREFERLVMAADGMTLITGPTGSGKTTTLYTCLQTLNRSARKIITVEDPIEYRIAGINQVPVNAGIGMTFASALRAMLRQSPDAVMVGEIRDRETAEIAIQAALTGHQVFSTLHTNDAPAAVTRLIDMGARAFLVAAALRAVVAQRLVRRVCPACAVPVTPSPAELRTAGWTEEVLAGAEFRRGRGCVACAGTGYQGRLGIFEIFLVNEEIRRLIHEQAGLGPLRECARRAGWRTLRQDGLRKVLAGLTTIDEVVGATVGDAL